MKSKNGKNTGGGTPKEMMSRREYAEYRGLSEQYIGRQVKLQRLPFIDGKIPVEDADRVLHERVWPPNTNEETRRLIEECMVYRTRQLALKAKLLEMDIQKKCGEMLFKKEVSSAFFLIARGARDSLESIPDRVGLVLAAETNPENIKKTLLEEIRAVLHPLSEAALEERLNCLAANVTGITHREDEFNATIN